MSNINVGQTLFCHISHGGVFEFEVQSVADVGHGVHHIVVSGRNKFTEADVVLLCTFDGKSIEVFKILSQSGEDSSHWYLRGETRLHTNPFGAYADSVQKDLVVKKRNLALYEKETRQRIADMRAEIAEAERGLSDHQFLLAYSKRYGLRTESFPIHRFLPNNSNNANLKVEV